MSTIDEVFDYVMNSPENTNPSVLRSLLNNVEDSRGSNMTVLRATRDAEDETIINFEDNTITAENLFNRIKDGENIEVHLSAIFTGEGYRTEDHEVFSLSFYHKDFNIVDDQTTYINHVVVFTYFAAGWMCEFSSITLDDASGYEPGKGLYTDVYIKPEENS